MTLGEKIKKRRKELKLTQEQLAGDVITRNMISRIESGTARPSLYSLEAIAEKLGMPPSYFLEAEETSDFAEKSKRIAAARLAYREGRFVDCTEEAEPFADVDDECALLCCLAYFEIGRTKTKKGALDSGSAALQKSLEYAAKTVYPTDAVTAMIPMWRAVCDNVKSPLLGFDPAPYLTASRGILDEEFFRYLTADADYPYENPLYAAHVKAKGLIKAQKFDAAIRYLTEAEGYKSGALYNAYVLLSVYTDMEFCCRQLCDFEMAYRYASKRISMMEGFRS